MTRILSVESGDGTRPGYTLEIRRSDVSSFRAEVRSPEEQILMAASGAFIDGGNSLLESVANFCDVQGMRGVGQQLVDLARLELAQSAQPDRGGDSVPGWRLTEILADALAGRTALVMPPDVRLTPDQATAVAAVCAMAVKMRFEIRERT